MIYRAKLQKRPQHIVKQAFHQMSYVYIFDNDHGFGVTPTLTSQKGTFGGSR